MNDTLSNWDSYPNRTSRDFGHKGGLMLPIRVRWWVMEGGYVYRTMSRKAVKVILIYKGFSYLHGSVFVIGAMHVMAVSKQSWY
jgi:hypothetical protein